MWIVPFVTIVAGIAATRARPVDLTVYTCKRHDMKISVAESLVMAALWRRHPLSAEEISSEIADAQDWSEATVKTLLNRLLKKKAVAVSKDGRRFLYRPLLKKADYAIAESTSLLDRLFDGQLAPLVSHFSERGKLDSKDIAELKRLIAGLDDGK